MKKITLFFMSLFLAFGTTMAKDEENVEFALESSTPKNGEMVTTVWNIRMMFSKPITLTQSEVNIDVVNSQTNEVVKITSCAVDEWNNKEAVFYFERIEVEGEKGKEYQDQSINALGSYTYTIPAGLIKSADGTEEFAGGTYTFSIVGTFDVESCSPQEAAVVESIVVTFDREITEVKLPASGLSILDNSWMPFVKVSEAVINEDKKSVTLVLESPITTPGTYSFDLYQGVFVSENAINNYSYRSFKVIDPTPGFMTNYQDGDKVKVSEFGNLEISFKNVKDFEMVDGQKITVLLPNRVEIAGTVEKQENKFVVTFDDVDFVEGNYVFTIPAGAFTMNGVANEEGKSISVELYTFKLIDLEVVSVTPVVGEIENITQIVVKFNQYVKLYYDNDGVTPSQDIYLTCGDEMYKLTCTGGSPFISDELVYARAEWDGFQYVYDPITAPGTYTLNLEDIIVFHGADDIVENQWYSYAETWHVGDASCKGTYSWTIKGDTSVENVPAAEGEQVIYDLLGRRVESITGAGIYIVNGKKVVIK